MVITWSAQLSSHRVTLVLAVGLEGPRWSWVDVTHITTLHCPYPHPRRALMSARAEDVGMAGRLKTARYGV